MTDAEDIIASYLARKLTEAFALIEHKTSLYNALSKVAGEKNVTAWKKLAAKSEPAYGGPTTLGRRKKSKRKGKRPEEKVQSVYMLDKKKGTMHYYSM